jgi:hypothetical protein
LCDDFVKLEGLAGIMGCLTHINILAAKVVEKKTQKFIIMSRGDISALFIGHHLLFNVSRNAYKMFVGHNLLFYVSRNA